MQEMQVQFLGQEDPLEKGMVTNSSSLTWNIPWAEDPYLSVAGNVFIRDSRP